MSKTKVRRDEHGLYVRGAGYIFRKDFPVGYDHVPEWVAATRFNEGDEVSVSHPGGPMGTISGEKWFIHGSYYPSGSGPQPLPGRKLLTSTQCFRPSYHTWREKTA